MKNSVRNYVLIQDSNKISPHCSATKKNDHCVFSCKITNSMFLLHLQQIIQSFIFYISWLLITNEHNSYLFPIKLIYVSRTKNPNIRIWHYQLFVFLVRKNKSNNSQFDSWTVWKCNLKHDRMFHVYFLLWSFQKHQKMLLSKTSVVLCI